MWRWPALARWFIWSPVAVGVTVVLTRHPPRPHDIARLLCVVCACAIHSFASRGGQAEALTEGLQGLEAEFQQTLKRAKNDFATTAVPDGFLACLILLLIY